MAPRVLQKSINVEDCICLRRNPQYMSPVQMDALKRSIRQDGFLCPIIVTRRRKKRYEVIAGNHRLMAAAELKMKTIPAMIISAKDGSAMRIALNTNTIHGDPKAELMAPFLSDLSDDVLAEIYFPDKLLGEIVSFDRTLQKRIRELKLPDALNHDSIVQIPNCRCPKCGRLHVDAAGDSRSR